MQGVRVEVDHSVLTRLRLGIPLHDLVPDADPLPANYYVVAAPV
jgi:hypothetical protein